MIYDQCQSPPCCSPCCPTRPRPPCPPLFCVIYDANGGMGHFQERVPAGAYIVRPLMPLGIMRPGFVFVGWNTQVNGTGTAYQPGDSAAISTDITLYAQWEALFMITYDPNGGMGFLQQVVPVGPYIAKTLAETGISRPGFVFMGWNTQPDGTGDSYQPGVMIQVKGSITLYAQWQAPYLAIYDGNGGTGFFEEAVSPGAYMVKTNTAVGIERTGFTFTGWNTQPDGTGDTYHPNDVINITANLALFAQWAPT